MTQRGSKPGERRGGRKPGTPNKATTEIKALAQKHGPKVIKELATLAGLVEGGAKAEGDTARIAALKEILDRGYGRPAQAIIGDEDNPIQLKTRVELVVIDPKS